MCHTYFFWFFLSHKVQAANPGSSHCGRKSNRRVSRYWSANRSSLCRCVWHAEEVNVPLSWWNIPGWACRYLQSGWRWWGGRGRMGCFVKKHLARLYISLCRDRSLQGAVPAGLCTFELVLYGLIHLFNLKITLWYDDADAFLTVNIKIVLFVF